MRTKQLISYPTLNDKNGDPTKDWYVEYSFRLPGDDQLHRFRICGGLRRTVPTDQRYTIAAEIIRDRTEYLKSGIYLDNPNDTSPLRKDDTHRPEHQRFTERSEQYRLPYIIDSYMQDMKGTIRLGSFRKYQGEMNVFLDWIKAENQPLYCNEMVTKWYRSGNEKGNGKKGRRKGEERRKKKGKTCAEGRKMIGRSFGNGSVILRISYVYGTYMVRISYVIDKEKVGD